VTSYCTVLAVEPLSATFIVTAPSAAMPASPSSPSPSAPPPPNIPRRLVKRSRPALQGARSSGQPGGLVRWGASGSELAKHIFNSLSLDSRSPMNDELPNWAFPRFPPLPSPHLPSLARLPLANATVQWLRKLALTVPAETSATPCRLHLSSIHRPRTRGPRCNNACHATVHTHHLGNSFDDSTTVHLCLHCTPLPSLSALSCQIAGDGYKEAALPHAEQVDEMTPSYMLK
jgi:hypothetical protein